MGTIYTTVYDVAHEGFDWMLLVAAVFSASVATAFIFTFFSIKRKRLHKKDTSAKRKLALAAVSSALALLLTLLFTWQVFAVLAERGDIMEAIKNKDYLNVDGAVQYFAPGEKYETFSINGVSFIYSPYFTGYGFKQLSGDGGPIRENGQNLIIDYVHINGKDVIIKLQTENP